MSLPAWSLAPCSFQGVGLPPGGLPPWKGYASNGGMSPEGVGIDTDFKWWLLKWEVCSS